MNKTPHRGTIKYGASSKSSIKRLRRQNIRSPSQAIGARPCPFRILVVQRHRRCSAAKSRPSSFEQRALVATAKLARHSHVHLRQRTHNVESRPRDALRREVIGRHDVVMEQLVRSSSFSSPLFREHVARLCLGRTGARLHVVLLNRLSIALDSLCDQVHRAALFIGRARPFSAGSRSAAARRLGATSG